MAHRRAKYRNILQKPFFFAVPVLLLAFAFVATGCGDREATFDPAAREAARREAEGALAALSDSARRALYPLDTLFVTYDREALQPQYRDAADAEQWVDSLLGTLTLDERVGQLFLVDLPESGSLDALIGDEARRAIEVYGVGGFLVSRVAGPRAVFRRTQALQSLSKIPLFFAADYERGAGRFNNAFTELPSNMAIGATRDTFYAAAAGRLTALESKATGINLLFAPVVDVNNNPENPIINIRSYGEDPDMVGHMAAAFVNEAERHGVLTTLKHFPGHGDTSVDSHAELGTVEGSLASLGETELKPYRIIFDQPHQPAGVMSAHLWIKALDEEEIPATFSRRALSELLRDSLGFRGIVFTDDIKMGALLNNYDLDERVVRPLLAGADIILTPRNLGEAIAAVKEALLQGRISRENIDASVRRILRAKADAGLHRDRYADQAHLDYMLQAPRGAYLAQAIADRAVTLLKSSSSLPLQESQRIGLVQISNYRGSESIQASMDHFARSIGMEDEVRLDADPSQSEMDDALAELKDADVVVLSLFLRLVSGRGEAGLLRRQEQLVQRLLASGKPVVLVTFGNPYAVSTYPDADAFLVAYDQTLESVWAAAHILKGLRSPVGRLPITIGEYAFGSGLDSL